MAEFAIDTERTRFAADVTDAVARHATMDGFWRLAVPHTTCALTLSEVDEDLLLDWERLAGSLFAAFEPFRHARNDNPNAAAHLFSSLLGTTLVVRVSDGRLDLGRYQRVVLLELDGPKRRTIRVDRMG